MSPVGGSRHRVTLRLTYKAPGAEVLPECLPTVPCADGFRVHSAYITAAGKATLAGETLEFQDMRIYLQAVQK